MTKIRTSTSARRAAAVDLDVPHEQRRYVALRQIRLGGGWKQAGDSVTAEELKGRNVRSMLEHHDIASTIEPNKPKRGAGA